MTDLPPITIGIITYSRFNEIQQTVASLRDHIIYPDNRLKWLISDDCSPDDYLRELSLTDVFRGLDVRFVRTPRNSGWGANANNMLSHVETPYVYLSEDDWVLCKPLDLRAGVGLLETRQDVGILRYGGTSGDMIYHYRQNETTVGDYVKENLDAADYVEGKLTYLIIDKDSPALYVYSGRPHLAKLRFYYDLGLFAEGLRLGETEDNFAHRVKDYLHTVPDAQQIAILPDFINMKYRHIGGASWQHSAHDIARVGGV